MDEPDTGAPPLPFQRTASPAAWQAGCVTACGLALVPILYVVSFVYLTLDSWNDWGFMDSLDPRMHKSLERIYAPPIWLCEQFIKIVSDKP